MDKHDQIVALLDRINNTRVNNTRARELQILGDYNVWHFFQQRLYRDAESYVDGTTHKEQPLTVALQLKNALLHVFALIFTLAAALSFIVKKRKVIVFSIDKDSSPIAHNDFRINDLYSLFTKHKIPYVEVFYSLLNRELYTNALARKRSALYLRGIDALFTLSFYKRESYTIDERDLEGLNEQDRAFVRESILRYAKLIPRAAFRVKVLTHLLKLSGSKLLFTIDSARDYHEALLAAKLAGIKSMAFQHGFYNRIFVGWLRGSGFSGTIVAPDQLYVWSEYWSQVLKRLNSVFTDIRVGGMSKAIKPKTKAGSSHGITVLVPYEARAYHNQVTWYLKKILEHPNTKIIFKTRPDRSSESQLKEYGLEAIENRLVVESNTTKALEQSDMVLGTYSTFLYEMVMAEVPVVMVKTDMVMGDELVGDNFATLIDRDDDIYQKLSLIKATSAFDLAERRIRLCGESPKLLRDTLETIAKEEGLLG